MSHCKFSVTTLKYIGFWALNGTGVLMDTMLSMNQEHALIDVKGPDILDYITMRVATRLRTVMIFFFLCYIQNTLFSFQLFSQKKKNVCKLEVVQGRALRW